MTITRTTSVEELPQFLSVEETAIYLAISKALVYEMVKRGDLRGVRFGRLLRIPRTALRALIEGGKDEGSDS